MCKCWFFFNCSSTCWSWLWVCVRWSLLFAISPKRDFFFVVQSFKFWLISIGVGPIWLSPVTYHCFSLVAWSSLLVTFCMFSSISATVCSATFNCSVNTACLERSSAICSVNWSRSLKFLDLRFVKRFIVSLTLPNSSFNSKRRLCASSFFSTACSWRLVTSFASELETRARSLRRLNVASSSRDFELSSNSCALLSSPSARILSSNKACLSIDTFIVDTWCSAVWMESSMPANFNDSSSNSAFLENTEDCCLVNPPVKEPPALIISPSNVTTRYRYWIDFAIWDAPSKSFTTITFPSKFSTIDFDEGSNETSSSAVWMNDGWLLILCNPSEWIFLDFITVLGKKVARPVRFVFKKAIAFRASWSVSVTICCIAPPRAVSRAFA